MAIVASFNWSGSLPGNIQFTDTSTGSPNSWFWDFGDGETSDEENPSHTYTTAGPFTVTLKVWQVISTDIINPSRSDALGKNSLPKSTNPSEEYSDFLAASFISVPSVQEIGYNLSNVSGDYLYAGNRITYTFDLAAFSDRALAIFQFGFWSVATNPQGGLKTNTGGILYARTPFATPFNVEDVTASLGSSLVVVTGDISDFTQSFSTPIDGERYGWAEHAGTARVIAYTATDIDSTSDIIGGDIIVDFDVSASSGTISDDQILGENVLAVTLRNLSSAPVGSTYSWGKRQAGTSDPYEEISIAENPPSIDFDRINP